jgi:hypothetical protein
VRSKGDYGFGEVYFGEMVEGTPQESLLTGRKVRINAPVSTNSFRDSTEETSEYGLKDSETPDSCARRFVRFLILVRSSTDAARRSAPSRENSGIEPNPEYRSD